jgi:hypothetical protein
MAGWAAAATAAIQLTGTLLEYNSGYRAATEGALRAQSEAIRAQNARAEILFALYLQDTYPLEKERNAASLRLMPFMEDAERARLLAGTAFSENAYKIAAPMQAQLAKDIEPDFAYARGKAKGDVEAAFDQEAQAQELRRIRSGVGAADPTAMAARDQMGLARASTSALAQNEAVERERQAGIANQFRFVEGARMPGAGALPSAVGAQNASAPFATTGSNVAGNLALMGSQAASNANMAESITRGLGGLYSAWDSWNQQEMARNQDYFTSLNTAGRQNAQFDRGV